MSNLIKRTIITTLVVVISTLVFLPNILSQKLAVVFNEYHWVDGEKKPTDIQEISDFMKDRENGLGLFFPGHKCKPEATSTIPATHRCVLESKFITSARVNEVVQENAGLIDETHTIILPHPLERFFSFLTEKDYKNLQVKLGLDLQGGMRATFRADFETYLAKLKEKYEPVLVDLKGRLKSGKLSAEDKQNVEARINNIEDLLRLSETRKQQLLSESKSIIDKRLASQNLTEPEVRVQPASYSIGVDMPGVANSSEVLGKIKDTVTVEYRIVNNEATDKVNSKFQVELTQIRDLYRKERIDIYEINKVMESVRKNANLSPDEGKIYLYWRRGRREGTENLPREFRVLGPAVMDGSDMTNAQENPNPNSGWYDISFVLSGPGAEKFGKITTENVGKRLAILWGDRVVSDPNINSPIVGGFGVIQGDFSRGEAAEVANVIREGALPISLEIISVSYVGPGLGQESIISGIVSILIGFFMVIVFMVFYYRVAGMIAVIALFLNLLLMGAILSLLEFTLTLPGFAGVILTVGMAVDANVIIFEKMKEELALGKALSVAIENGFTSSFWTILDANITTLIAAVILYYNGDGPIKGFAITLFFGLVSSIFTALYVSHLTFDWVQYFIKPATLKPVLGLSRRSK